MSEPPAGITLPDVSGYNGRASGEPGSVLADLRARAARQREEKFLELELPGEWEGALRVRYRVISVEDADRYTKLDLSRTSNFSVAADFMNRCCAALLAYSPARDAWESLDDERGPVSFDDRLGRLLNMPRLADDIELSPYDVVMQMFGGNPLALDTHVSRLVNWMRGNQEGVDLGEASTATLPATSAPPQS